MLYMLKLLKVVKTIIKNNNYLLKNYRFNIKYTNFNTNLLF